MTCFKCLLSHTKVETGIMGVVVVMSSMCWFKPEEVYTKVSHALVKMPSHHFYSHRL